MHFEFTTAARIVFGSGRLNTINDLISGLSHRIFIVHGGPAAIYQRLVDNLDVESFEWREFKIEREPTSDLLQLLVDTAKSFAPGMIIGIGGGSTIDSAKALAALLTNPGNISDYLEVVGNSEPLRIPPTPLIAVPTTAGTGSEVTKNAVVGVPRHKVKVSLRSHYLLPKIALVDPQLTLALPSHITAFTGLDALTQLIEPYTCSEPNAMVDVLSLEGIRRIGKSLFRVYNDGNDLEAREDMSLASLFSGLALANARLGVVHGLAGPLGGEIHAPHGAICASLLPHALHVNLSSLQKREPGHPSIQRYAIIAQTLTGDRSATAIDGIQWMHNFCQHAGIPSLSTLGLNESQIPGVIHKSSKASSMKGNPIILSDQELRNILEMAF